ncbi:MAG: DNA polymerase III subunit beta [Blastocatellia bacterium]|nr:DNA polymerase III subunit beta [Blastocatellia bacterium]
MFASTQETLAPTANNLFTLAAVETPNRNIKLSIARNALRIALDLLAEVVEAKQAYPLFSHLLLEARADRLRLRGVGLYNTLQCDVEADVQQTGSFCLPAKKLADIVRHLPAATIDLISNAEAATLKCGDSRFKLKTHATDEFPALAEANETIATIPIEILLTMLRTVLFAAARTADNGRYALEGAQLTFSPTGLRVVATDGHRLLCVERSDLTRDDSVILLLPRHSLPLILKFLSVEPGEVQLRRNENKLVFQHGTRLLACTLLDGAFPDCEPILLQEFQHALTLEGTMFQAAIQRMAVFGTEGTGSSFGVIRFHFAPDGSTSRYEVQSFAPGSGEGQEEILPLTADAQEAVTISFNGRYLLDFARTISASAITIQYNDARTSVAISPATDNGCVVRYILMPCLV